MLKYDFKKILSKSESGYSLIIVLLVLVLLSVLGLSLLNISANTMKSMTNERDDQSAYYIAEAGLNDRKVQLNIELNNAMLEAQNEYKKKVAENERKKPSEREEINLISIFYETVLSKINQHSITYKYEKHLNEATLPYANVTATSIDGREYIIRSEGKIGKKTRTVEQNVKVEFDPGTVSNEGSNLKSCANGYFTSLNTSGSVDMDGDIVLKSGGNLTADGKINGDLYSFGDVSFQNSIKITGNVFSTGDVNITNTPAIDGQLYSKGKINITNAAYVTGDIVSENTISITNWGTKANKIISTSNITAPDPNLTLIKNVPIDQLPLPAIGSRNISAIFQLYEGSDCTNMIDSNVFKPKMPNVTFPSTSTNLTSNTINFKDSSELHFNEIKKSSNISIILPNGEEDQVYSLYVNSLRMDNYDMNISGNGKLNIYVKDSLGLGSVIQGNNSSGKKRSNFDTTIYYLSDNKTSPYLSNWGKSIESNLYIKNSNLNTNQSKIQGNVVVLGNNTVTLKGNSNMNTQIFYLPDSNLIAENYVNIKGYVVANNVSGSGNVTISKPLVNQGEYINSDLFEKPSNYENAKVLLSPVNNIQEIE